ncbi:MAG: ATP-dependent Lon protease [Parvicellaceae bacterium]|jgi:ATP-dependent Lon protease
MDDVFDLNMMHFSDFMNKDAEFIPLISSEDEDRMNKEELPDELPILSLRNNVLFPGVVIPITVGRDKSIKLIQDANAGDKTIGVISQRDPEIEEPGFEDLNVIGTVGQIVKQLKMPDGSTTVIIQGKKRFKLGELITEDPYIRAKVHPVLESEPNIKDVAFKALVSSIKDLAMNIINISPNIPTEATFAIKNIESPSFLVNFISSHMNAEVHEKQKILEIADITVRSEALLTHLTKEQQMLELKNDIQTKVKVDIDRQQKEYFLHQQMRQIQDELGENPTQQEIHELKDNAKAKKWKDNVRDTFDKEVQKLERMNPSGAEYSVQLNYCQLLCELPWGELTKDKFDLKRAQRILDRDHFGLDKVKERIIEYLAVLKLKNNMKAPIICLYGPPGVGKTSLGKSVAEALGRKYVRMSLGGIRDEAEIRGHRKTYIGAMPGRVIQNIKKAKSSNPVFILDEIDKIARDNHGDPSSALLEVLDPEQNSTFQDNYVELEYDLSKVLFIATANSLSTIQPALLDRMELIEVNGYTVEEKIEIAKRHLIPKQIEEHGITKKDVSFSKKTLESVVENYTFESGVRGLEKKLAKLVRSRAKDIAMEDDFEVKIGVDNLAKLLGPAHPKDKYQLPDVAGVVTGLAWTRNGGDILFIESSLTKGKGKLTLTGNLGDVMKESAIIALEYLKSHCTALDIDPVAFDNYNIHIHVPQGATPKDGPSAGITMLTALASLFTQRRVKKFTAMTGEITLRGKVLPVGGIKEKILAAKRANITDIILCENNRKDIEDVKADYLKGMNFHYVNEMMEVLDVALLKQKVKNAIKV